MYLVNGQEFDEYDLTPASLELTGHLSEEQKNELVGFLMNEWPEEAEKGAALMIREGYNTLQLGHISDCVSQENGLAFIASIEDYLKSI